MKKRGIFKAGFGVKELEGFCTFFPNECNKTGREVKAMKIRLMTIDDYENVSLLWHTSSGMQLREIDDSREKVEKFLKRNPKTCFVAVENGIVGAVLAGNDGRRGYLYHLAVAEAFQHRHIGTALVQAAEAALLQEGIPKVGILVFRSNDDGNAFWEKLGYVDRSHLVYRSRALVKEAE